MTCSTSYCLVTLKDLWNAYMYVCMYVRIVLGILHFTGPFIFQLKMFIFSVFLKEIYKNFGCIEECNIPDLLIFINFI